ncbi:MAG: hypothetical protein OXI77_17350 [Chloroflexota bacterium]|nr:hypothetical protein [Chloroflexota bacterium]MDE2910189.1 hypothetical protein [Chloroflexota bacterium]
MLTKNMVTGFRAPRWHLEIAQVALLSMMLPVRNLSETPPIAANCASFHSPERSP